MWRGQAKSRTIRQLLSAAKWGGLDYLLVDLPPGTGDDSRGLGPFPNHGPHPERSGLFLFANLNKRGVTLNLEEAAGRRLMGRLLESAEVFLENQPLELLRKTG